MHKILIIDDERAARDLVAELITFYIPDSKVTKTDSAFKALEIIQTEDYDLLFVDISMPRMSGLELLEEVKRMGKEPYSFIITAHRQYDYAVKGFRLGILDYIEKPLHKEKIGEAAKLYLSKAKTDTIDLRVYDGIRRIPISAILAVEVVSQNKVKVYTSDFIFKEVTGTLAKFLAQLPSNFCYIRRDCIINCHAVTHYNLKSQVMEVFVVCENQEIMFKVARNKRKNLLDRYNFE